MVARLIPSLPPQAAVTLPAALLKRTNVALVAELVDALVSGTSGESRGGSSPLLGTKHPLLTGLDDQKPARKAGFLLFGVR